MTAPSFDLGGRVALVTGSSRGIGAAIARALASAGAGVAVHGRDASAVRAECDRIASAGGRAAGVTGDVRQRADVERIVRQAEDRLGPIDILVANAGGNLVPPGPVEELDEETFRATVDENLTATFLCVRAVLPGMKARRRGSIVTISSAAARRPTDRSPAAYTAAKAGIELLTRIIAQQAGPFGVRANCIAPETILTERNRERIPAPVQAQLASTHPLRRLGTPDDVAGAVVYLASDAASWVTGVVVDVAGGAVMA